LSFDLRQLSRQMVDGTTSSPVGRDARDDAKRNKTSGPLPLITPGRISSP
jgi:hypothetical protein